MNKQSASRLTLSDRFSEAAHWVSQQCGRAHTFIVAILLIIAWALCGPVFHYSDTWQLIINTGTTIVTFLMVFLIQNTQNRDTIAIQLKLDELIRANENARNLMMALEDLTENQLKRMKENLAASVSADDVQQPLETAQEKLQQASEKIEQVKDKLIEE